MRDYVRKSGRLDRRENARFGGAGVARAES
jgi:hypothetical protein